MPLDLCIGLIILCFGLVLFALIGHGLWQMLGGIFRALTGTEGTLTERCLGCGRPLADWERICPRCGRDRDTSAARELADLEATERQLERFAESATLEDSIYQRLMRMVEARRRHLLGERPVPVVKPAPVVPPLLPLEPPPVPVAAVEIIPPLPLTPEPTAPVAAPAAERVEEEPLDAIPVLKPVEMPVAVAPSISAPPASFRRPDRGDEPRRSPESLPPPPPRRSLAEVLAAFMEEKNILWGELIGGLLIVGCSIALVISLWQTLDKIQYFPFLVMAGITAALIGAGLYTLHHWNLESISRTLLVIGTLLVPLDFLVLAGLRGEYQVSFLIDPAVVVGSLALFAYLLQHAGQVLLPEQRWLLPAAVLVPAAGQLVVSWADPLTLGLFLGVGLLTTACHCLSVEGMVCRVTRPGPLGAAQALHLHGFLGIATFALTAALGFLVFRTGDFSVAWQRLALLVSAAGIAPLACGLVVHRHLAGDAEQSSTRTTGTAVALTGMLAMLVAVALAWPEPAALIAVCTLNFAVLTAVAFREELPVAHVAALPCAALGYLTAVYVFVAEPNASLARWLYSPTSGTALVFFVGVLYFAAEGLLTVRGMRPHATAYAVGSGVLAALSLAQVTRAGDAHPVQAMVVYAFYGAGSLILNRRWQRGRVRYIGLALLVAASLWGLHWQAPGRWALWGAAVAAEALLLGLIRTQGKSSGYLTRPLADVSEWTGFLALFLGGLAIYTGPQEYVWSFAHVVTGVCLAALYSLLTVGDRRPVLAWLSSAMVLASVVMAAGWAGVRAEIPHLQALIGLCVAGSGGVLALLSLGVARQAQGEEHTFDWRRIFALAWRDTAAMASGIALMLMALSPTFPGPGLHAATLATVSLTGLLLAWAFQTPVLTWLASFLLFCSLSHALTWHETQRSQSRSVLLALLLHATLALLTSLTLQARRLREAASWDRLPGIITEPLRHSAFVASVAAVPLVALPTRGEILPFAGLAAWLATFWLVVSWLERWPRVFLAFQAGLSVAVLYAVTAWLDGQPWVMDNYLPGLLDPRSVQAYGLGLATLGLAWAVLRLVLPAAGTLRELFDAARPGFDEVVLGVLVVGQLALTVGGVVPGVFQEMTPAVWEIPVLDVGAHAYGPGAWALLGALAIVVALTLWQRWPTASLLGLTLLAVTVPVLSAGPFAPQKATASALRWGLAGCFLACAIPLWLRGPLGTLAARTGIRFREEDRPARAVRSLLFISALPVIVLSGLGAYLIFLGLPPTGPEGTAFFGRMGWLTANVVPLVLVSLVLVGYALRERAAGYAFAAGLLLDAVLMTGYAVHVVLRGIAFGEIHVVQMMQLGTAGAAVWALLWLASRRWAAAWFEGPETPEHAPLMAVQVALALLGTAVLLFGAFVSLALLVPRVPYGFTDPVYLAAAPWAVAAGAPLGWTALALAAATVFYRRHLQGRGLDTMMLGTLGLAAVLLLACDVAGWSASAHGYRTLMLGWAVSSVAWALVGLRRALFTGNEQTLRRPGAKTIFWVNLTGLLAVLLGFKAAFYHQDQLCAASAIGTAAVAGAVTAVARRREGGAFLAGLGLNAAAMLLVWHFHRGIALEDWLVYLVQANCVAGGLGGLLWLAARKRLYPRAELRLSASPLLAAQLSLALLGNILMLGFAFLTLLLWPYSPAGFLEQVGKSGGWLALLLPMLALFWYGARASLPDRFTLAGLHALLLGILAACSVAPWDTLRLWLAYHVLELSWVTAGLCVLSIGLVAAAFEASAGEHEGEPARWTALLRATVPEVQRWAEIIGLGVVILAMRGVDDPQRPFWSAGATLAVSLMTTGMALWSRRSRHVWQSGILLNLAGCFVWFTYGPHSIAGFVSVNVLALGIGSAFWTVLELALMERLRPREGKEALPYRHVAVIIGLAALAVLAGFGLFTDLEGIPLEMTSGLTWLALAAVTGALVLLLWDTTAKLSSFGLYIAGLTAIALAFNTQHLPPTEFGWSAALALAGYIWVATGANGLTNRSNVRSFLRWPERSDTADWLAPAQTLVSAVVVALSVWISLAFSSPKSFAGALASAVIVPAGVMLAEQVRGHRARSFRWATLLLPVLAVTEVGWAAVGSEVPALALHRSIVVMAALALMAGVYAVMTYRLPAVWARTTRQFGPVLHVASLVALLAVLGQEVAMPHLEQQIAPWAIAAVALALLWLVAAGLCYAVLPGRDPFELSEQGRHAYVYAGEVLLVLLGVHLRMCLPYLFTGMLRPYYPLILMGLAFLGVGLAVLFRRLGLRVLAEPLERTGMFLPLLPALVFWFRPSPLADLRLYALVWVLATGLYATLAMLRQSFRFALLAGFTANFGLWSLLHYHGQGFLFHPQLWMIPLAAVLLVAEQINRPHLPHAQSVGLRYLALGMLYLSSTADMFLNGIGRELWLPVVLMFLSVGGMLLGILLRVQAYLFLGVGFLLMDIVAMIYHAAGGGERVWVWFVSGIALGVSLLVLFGIFEKRGDDVRRLLHQIKQWD